MNKLSVALLLAFCLLLSSCGMLSLEFTVTEDTTHKLSDGTPSTSYTEIVTKDPVTLPTLNPENSAENYLSTLPDMDFVQKYFGDSAADATVYFTIATVEDAPVFASADEISGSSVAKALNAVEEKYNIDIIQTQFSPQELDTKIKESELSGRYFVDLMYLPSELAKTYALADYCKTVGSLPYIDQSAPYFVNDVFKYGGDFGKYAVLGESSYLTKDLLCLYFDASAISGEIYTKALESSLDWTYISALMAQTGRGISSSSDLSHVFRLSVGARYTLTKDGDPTLENSPFAPNEQEKQTSIDAFNAEYEKIKAHITDENPLFIVDTIGNFREYTSQSTRYGILPLPSAENGETYGALAQGREYYWLCPSHTTTAEGAGIVIASLCAASCQNEAQILLTLIRDNARDNGTLLVSNLLFSKPAWDIEFLNVKKDEPPKDVPKTDDPLIKNAIESKTEE